MSTTRDLPLLPEIVTGAAKLAVSAAGGKSGDLWMIPPDHVHIDPLDNVRPLDPKHVKHLSMLIEEHGFDKSQPLGCIVKRIDGQDLVYVYSGQHRYHAAMLAIERGVHIPALPCVIRDAKTVSRRSLIITGVNNNSSEPLSPLDLAGAIDALKREGLTETEITQQLHITQQTVRDVMLLAAAPAQIHTMIRKNQIKSTLAIEQIRKHGPDKAAQLLEKTVDAALATGKTKVTKKDLPKTEPIALDRTPAPKPTAAVQAAPDRRTGTAAPDVSVAKPEKSKPTAAIEPHVAAAYAALRAVASDQSFRELPIRVRDLVMSAIGTAPAGLGTEAGIGKLDRSVDVANEHGIFDECEAIELKQRRGGGPIATIYVAHPNDASWISTFDLNIDPATGAGRPGPGNFHAIHSSRDSAIRGAVTEITRLLHGHAGRAKSKDAAKLNLWLDKLWALSDPDSAQSVAGGIAS